MWLRPRGQPRLVRRDRTRGPQGPLPVRLQAGLHQVQDPGLRDAAAGVQPAVREGERGDARLSERRPCFYFIIFILPPSWAGTWSPSR